MEVEGGRPGSSSALQIRPSLSKPSIHNSLHVSCRAWRRQSLPSNRAMATARTVRPIRARLTAVIRPIRRRDTKWGRATAAGRVLRELSGLGCVSVKSLTESCVKQRNLRGLSSRKRIINLLVCLILGFFLKCILKHLHLEDFSKGKAQNLCKFRLFFTNRDS